MTIFDDGIADGTVEVNINTETGVITLIEIKEYTVTKIITIEDLEAAKAQNILDGLEIDAKIAHISIL